MGDNLGQTCPNPPVFINLKILEKYENSFDKINLNKKEKKVRYGKVETKRMLKSPNKRPLSLSPFFAASHLNAVPFASPIAFNFCSSSNLVATLLQSQS